jgi:hypothetical protein
MRFFEIDNQLVEAPLGKGLFKYANTKKDRIPILLNKIEKSEPFKIQTKTGIEDIVFDPTELSKVQQWINNPVGKLTIKSRDDDRQIPYGSIIKTKEFGGEEAGSREKVEQGQIADFVQQLESVKGNNKSISLQVGKTVVQAASAIKTPELINGRAPKSDMTILDPNGKSVAWVSLKGRPFRWGGWTHLAKTPELAAWIKRIKRETGNELEPGQSYGLHISDELKQQIIYGKDFGGPYGISNVNAILVGELTLEQASNGYLLSAPTVYENGIIPRGGDAPYLVIRYMNGRFDAGFKNARAETNTASEGRKVKWLDATA